jgi:ATP-dependent protease ClpP protease subunit
MSDKETAFVDENRFYILGTFTNDLNKTIVVPMTKKIEELSLLRDPVMDVYINSPGGNGYVVMHLIRLFEQAKANGIKVRTIIPSYAYSAGSMLAIAGTLGERYVGETAEHLVHYGYQYGWAETTPLQIDRNAAQKKRWFEQLLNHYKKYSNIPNIEAKVKDDSYFIPAEKCIKWGLADKYMSEMTVLPPTVLPSSSKPAVVVETK